MLVFASLKVRPAHGQSSPSCSAATRFAGCYVLEDSVVLFQNAETPIVRLTATVVTRRGQIVIADASEAHLKVFTSKGALLQVVGRKGQGPGEFEDPRVVSLSPSGHLHVVDIRLLRITQFDENFRFVRTVPLPAEISYVTAMSVDSFGTYHLAGVVGDGIALLTVDSTGRLRAALWKGSRGTKGLHKMWRILQSVAIGSSGPTTYLATTTADTLYTVDAGTKQITAFGIPVTELGTPPQPPEVFDRLTFAAWANSFFRPAQVFVDGTEVAVTLVHGNPFENATSILSLFRGGKWQILRDAPVILHVSDRKLLALLDPNPDRVVLGRFRRKP